MRTAILLGLLALSGCTAVVRGSPLSPRDEKGRAVYLSTGGTNRPYQILGFAQIRGYGVEVGGVVDVGDAALDSTIRGTLAHEAAKMGGDGVLHIEFLDENPSTDVDRANNAMATVSSFSSGRPQLQTKERYVTVTGEVIRFLDK
jgi:hypothetical protein